MCTPEVASTDAASAWTSASGTSACAPTRCPTGHLPSLARRDGRGRDLPDQRKHDDRRCGELPAGDAVGDPLCAGPPGADAGLDRAGATRGCLTSSPECTTGSACCAPNGAGPTGTSPSNSRSTIKRSATSSAGTYNPSLELALRMSELFALPVGAIFSLKPLSPLSDEVFGGLRG